MKQPSAIKTTALWDEANLELPGIQPDMVPVPLKALLYQKTVQLLHLLPTPLTSLPAFCEPKVEFLLQRLHTLSG